MRKFNNIDEGKASWDLKKTYVAEETYGLEDQILHKMELIDQLIPPSARYDLDSTGILPIYHSYFLL